MSKKLTLLLPFLIPIILSACSSKLHSDKKHQSNLLDKNKMDSLYTYLSLNSSEKLQDTIIIKYDFNGDGCWIALNQQSNDYIKNLIQNSTEWIAKKKLARPTVSIFQFKEYGENFSPYKLRDKTIKTDSGFLKKLLFNKRTMCGTSAVIVSSGKFFLIKSDSHFSPIEMSGAEISRKLNL